MKKILFIFSIIALAFVATSCDDDDDKKVSYESLPLAAKEFIQTHFSAATVRLVEEDNDSYDVYFTNGFEVDFDKDGIWKNVDGNYQALPETFLSLSPIDLINADAAARYQGAYITEVDKDVRKNGYEVKLNNNVELIYEWNGTYRGVDID